MSAHGEATWFGSRGATGRSFHLLTVENRYASGLAELPGATVVKLVTPRRAPARFAQYLLELEPGLGPGATIAPGFEHFLYVLDGVATTLVAGAETPLAGGGFAYVPDDQPFELRNESSEPVRLLWLKRAYEPAGGSGRPPPRAGLRSTTAEVELAPGLHRQELLEAGDPRHDFAISVLRFDPGAGLTMVEIHEEEHGLYMTRGAGIYLLEDEEHAVQRDDFIYMAPYCPQSFRADPAHGAEYMLYKDAFRDGF